MALLKRAVGVILCVLPNSLLTKFCFQGKHKRKQGMFERESLFERQNANSSISSPGRSPGVTLVSAKLAIFRFYHMRTSNELERYVLVYTLMG
jgi:hypothetical protein